MGEWESRIRNHRVWEVMKSLGPNIDKALQASDIESTALESIERLRAILSFCGKRLGASDPLTVLPSTLDSLAGSFETQATELNAFLNDSNTQHLNNANTSADTALATVTQVPGLASSEEIIGLIETVHKYRTTLDEHEKLSASARVRTTAEIQELNQVLGTLKTDTEATLAELRAQLEAEKQKISAQVSEQQRLFADEQSTRGAAYNETISKIQETLTKTFSDQQSQFSTSQENRNAQFTSLQGEYTRKLAEQDAQFSKELTTNVETWKRIYEKEGDSFLFSINKSKEKVEKLVGVIGELGVTSGYQTAAMKARNQMWFWQGMSVLAMAGLIFIAYRVFLPTILGEFKWEGLVARLFLTITVGVLAAYSVSQADRFFHQEKYNRRLALELAAIDPFIALLPEAEKEKFKLEIGRKTFAQEEVVAPGKSPATTLDLLSNSKQVQQLVESITEIAKTLAKKSP
jgi:hypothetical protein